MVYDYKRIPYRIDRPLTGLAGPDYDATISFGLPVEPEDSPYGKSRLRGLAYAESGDTRSAVEDLSKTIDLDPRLPEAYHNRGAAYRDLGELEEAIKDFDRAIELQPVNNLSR